MANIIIAGRPFPLEDSGVRVITFLDPGCLSFYSANAPGAVALVGTNEDGDTMNLVQPRRPPGTAVPMGLQGEGWDRLEGGWQAALSKTVRTVVLHHDGSPSSQACHRTLLQRSLSTHFMIERDGTVYQGTDVADVAWHAIGVNSVGVGIDLNSLAPNLLHNPDAPPPLGGRKSDVVEINGGQFCSWTYSPEQYRSLIAVLKALVNAVGLEPVFPMDQNGGILRTVLADPQPAQFAGIQCHWHSDDQKWDPGPGLDWEWILKGLRAKKATFPCVPVVRNAISLGQDRADRDLLAGGLFREAASTRDLLDESLSTEDTAARFLRLLSRACEHESGGGYYPMGVNQTWHGGIHVPCVRGTPVVPLLEGEVAALHLGPAKDFPRGLGSNNFVLLRHRIPLPVSMRSAVAPACTRPARPGEENLEVKEQAENVLVAFSLYMHLDAVDWDHPPATPLLQKLGALSRQEEISDPPSGPALDSVSAGKVDALAALRKGYVVTFPPDKEPRLVLNTGEVLGHAGEYGERTGGLRLVHVEVFADHRYLEAMDLALYGRYLALAEDDPHRDLVVRSETMLKRFGWEPDKPLPWEKPRDVPRSSKVLNAEAVRDFFETQADPEVRATLRRMIVRNVSEWSDRVDWAHAFLSGQDWAKDWARRLREPGAAGRLFQGEIASWLKFTWLTDKLAKDVGLEFQPGQEGVVAHFHPANFLMWWLFLRSAVRGKPIEEILQCRENARKSIQDGVPRVLDDFADDAGEGAWQY